MPTIRQRNGKFNAQVRIKHGGVIVHQESATFDTEKQAKLWGEKLEKRLESDGYATRQTERFSVADLMERHEAYLRKLGKPTLAISGRFKNLNGVGKLAKLPIGRVTSADIIEWASAFREGRSPATVLNHLMALSTAFRAGPVAHKIESDVSVVASAISHLKQLQVAAPSQERDRRVTDDEINAITACHIARYETVIPLGLILNLLVALPRRRGEILTAEWSNYDPVAGTLRLVDTKNPTRLRNEVIPVPPKAQAILAKLPRTGNVMLPYIGGSVSDAFHRCATLCGFHDLHLHDLRHEGISRLFEAGLNIPEVSSISGHLSWATLKRYTHIKPQTVLDKLRNK